MTDEQAVQQEPPMGDPTETLDVSKHDGKRVKIAGWKQIPTFSDYNEEGEHIPGLKRPTQSIKVWSETLELYTKKDGSKIPIEASEVFPLKLSVKDGVKIWVISPHAKGKLNNFMKKQKTTTLEGLKGTMVTVVVRPSQKAGDDREYLGFAM